MATTPKNIMYRKIIDTVGFENDPAVSYNEGDLVCLDTGKVRPIAAWGDVATLVGDVQGTNPVKYHGNVKNVTVNCGRHTVKLAAREAAAFNILTPVYFHTDAKSFGLTPNDVADVPLGWMLVEPAENNGTTAGTTVIGKEYEVLLRDSYIFSL